MKLTLLTPSEKILEKEVAQVTLPGTEGEMTILKGHAPLLATLKKGKLRYKEGELPKTVQIEGGFVDVLADQILVMTPDARTSEEGPSAR